jgi:hypothetical protein
VQRLISVLRPSPHSSGRFAAAAGRLFVTVCVICAICG